MIQFAQRLTTSKPFRGIIVAVILLAGVLAGVETSAPLVARHTDLLHAFNVAILAIFVAEIALKLLAHGRRPGLPVIAAGLAILATEFLWARRALRNAKGDGGQTAPKERTRALVAKNEVARKITIARTVAGWRRRNAPRSLRRPMLISRKSGASAKAIQRLHPNRKLEEATRPFPLRPRPTSA